jgi:dTDP-4-amino-4,6-dideoxygalactose transaminase
MILDKTHAPKTSGWSRTPGAARIPLVDLRANYLSIKSEVDRALHRVIDNSDYVLGEEVSAFEAEFAVFCGVAHAVGVASGSAALLLTLTACGVGRDDEVITTPFTFPAAVEAIVHRGAKPVFVDIRRDDYTIDPAKIEAAVSDRTKAIIPVHLYGYPADMEPILSIARAHGLLVIEDAAQSQGSSYKGRRVGGWGNLACFSFNPGKNLGAFGDAGAVVTSDPELAGRIRQLRDHGRSTRFEHELIGFGERMDSLQAAVLRVKLRYLDQWNQKRERLARIYDRLLEPVEEVTIRPLHHRASVAIHLYVIEVENNMMTLENLQKAGIQAGIHYPIPLHLQPAFAPYGQGRGSLPVAEEAAKRVLSLPVYQELTDAQVQSVVHALRRSL